MIDRNRLITVDELNTLYELTSALNQDKDGEYFLCSEDEQLLHDSREILKRLI